MRTAVESEPRSYRGLRPDGPSLRRGVTWLLAGQGGTLITQAVYFAVLARLLGRSEYGLYVGVFSLTTVLGQYSSLGSGALFLRYVSHTPGNYARYWGNILLSTGITGSILVIAGVSLGPLVLGKSNAPLLALAAISSCLCNQLVTCASQVFQTFQRMRITAMLTLFANAARMVLAVTMLVLLGRCDAVQWVGASLVLSAIVAIVSCTTVIRSFGFPRFELSLLKDRALEGIGFSAASSTACVYNDIDKVLLSHFGMNAANGVYSLAYRVIDMASAPIYALRDAVLPKLFKQGVEGIKPLKEITESLLSKAVLFNLAAALCMFVGAPLIETLVGREYAASVGVLRWLCLIPCFRGIHQLAGSALTGAGFQRYRTATQFMAAGSNAALNLWLIPKYGWLGAAWASLATDSGLAAANWCLFRALTSQAERDTVRLSRLTLTRGDNAA